MGLNVSLAVLYSQGHGSFFFSINFFCKVALKGKSVIILLNIFQSTLFSVLAFENSPSANVAEPCHGAHCRNLGGTKVGIYSVLLHGDEAFCRNL